MIFNKQLNVLVLAPHTDDGELGCGGTISKICRQGHSVYYIAFSAAEQSVSPEFPSDILRKEVVEATSVLGVNKNNLIVLDFEVRNFVSRRKDILEKMVSINREINPDLVFLPSTNDTHQDHQIISSEGFRAFKRTSILGYELPWNNLSFYGQVFIHLEDFNLNDKICALNKYESQSSRPYFNSEVVKSLSIIRGQQIGTKYAEAFENIRLVVR